MSIDNVMAAQVAALLFAEYQIDCPNCGGEGALEHPHLGGFPSYMAESPPDAVTVDCEECQGTGQKWTDDPLTLAECPPGLFLFEGTLGFKTEYGAMQLATPSDLPGDQLRWIVGASADAYCVESGEYFWGGTTDVTTRANLIVQPVAVAAARGIQP